MLSESKSVNYTIVSVYLCLSSTGMLSVNDIAMYRVQRSVQSALRGLQSCCLLAELSRRAFWHVFCCSGTILSPRMTPSCVTALEHFCRSMPLHPGGQTALFETVHMC